MGKLKKMGVPFIRCLPFLLLLISSGSSVETMKQTKKYDNLDDQKLFLFLKATRMLMQHDMYPTTTTKHDTYPTEIPVGPADVPIVNPTPTTTPITTPTSPTTTPTTTPFTAPPTIPTTTPTITPPTNPFTAPPTIPTTTPTTTPPTTPTTTPPTTPTTTPPNNPTPSSGGGGGGWCVAKSSASEKALQVALDYACGYGADCSAIQPGGSCYNPDTVRDHASYAFNEFYQKNGAPTSCSFGGVAQLVNKDPSSGSCHYASSGGSASTPPVTPTPTMQTPPYIMSPPSPMFPGNPIGSGGSGLGAKPIGSPNMATSISQQMLLLFSSSGLVFMYILLGNHP